MKPNVLVTHAIPPEGLEALAERTHLIFPQGDAFSPEELLAWAPTLDGVLAAGVLDSAFFAEAQRLRIVANYGAGYDGLDVQAATALGIPIATIADVVTQPTAELTLALMLCVSRRVGELNTAMREAGDPALLFGMGKRMGETLSGRTLGILGMGRIGGRVAALARAFGMSVRYHNGKSRRPEGAEGEGYCTLEELLRGCDILSIHCPLTEQTRGLIGAAQLGLMPRHAILINTARGAIVDTQALADRLAQGLLGGAGLDVFPQEPQVPPALIALPNVVLTPHIGSNTVSDRRRMAQAAGQRILDTLAGKTPEGVINPEIYQNGNAR